jgi:heat shock protein HslJ
MACADGMAQEQAFLAALAAVDGWRTLDRQVLELLDAQGEVLARFTAAPQP